MNNINNFSNIALVPKLSDIQHREEVDTTVNFLGHDFKLPVIPSNMKCCISPELAKEYMISEYMYIMHRFTTDPTISNIDYVKNFIYSIPKMAIPLKKGIISFSIGVDREWFTELHKIIENKLWYNNIIVTIDVAHGHTIMVKEQIKRFKNAFNDQVKIIAGNVMTKDAVEYLTDAGTDCCKIGLSCGASCSTFTQTGVGSPNMFDMIRELSSVSKIPLIADGGIRCVGDIVKAIVAGADMVMVGSLFAQCSDSPAPIIDTRKYFWQPHNYKKNYFGSASVKNKGTDKYVEGLNNNYLTITKTTNEFLQEIKEGLQSACSYFGCKSIEELKISNIEHIKF